MPLCPHCGYPLLLDRQPVVDDSAHKISRKPTEDPGMATHRPPPVAQPVFPTFPNNPSWFPAGQVGPPPPQMQVRGPLCSSCGHGNPAHRKRCERCGAELWPGAAFPPRMAPQAPPPAVTIGKRRSWWWLILLLVLLAVAAVWLLAYLL
jgi:hypothetical protein